MSDYEVGEIMGDVAFKLGRMPVKVFAHYINNFGADDDDATVGPAGTLAYDPEDEDSGWLAGLQLGKGRGGARLKAYYTHLEGDAILDNFVDSDLGGGGANREGVSLKFSYNILKYLSLNATALFAQRIEPTAFTIDPVTGAVTGDNEDDDFQTYQLDLIWKF